MTSDEVLCQSCAEMREDTSVCVDCGARFCTRCHPGHACGILDDDEWFDTVDDEPTPILDCVHDWRQVEIDSQVCWHCGQSRIAIYSGWLPF